MRRAFPALHIILDDLSTIGEISTVHWTARNAGPATRRANAAREQPDTVTGAIRIPFRHGQIAESWTEWDQTAILRRMGPLIDVRTT